jgi:hypothetical protein
MSKLTDNLMAQLYLGFANDYIYLKQQDRTADEIYRNLYFRLHSSFNANLSALCDLEPPEKQRALDALNTFMASCPQYRALPTHDKVDFFPRAIKPVQLNVINNSTHYCSSSDTIFTWMMLTSIMSNSNHAHHHHSGGCCSSSNEHREGSSNAAQVLALLLLLFLGLLSFVITLLSTYYIISQCLNSMERFLYNEGWLKATMTLGSIIAGGALGAFFGTFIASVPFIALGIAAGISNPIGIVIVGAACFSLIAAAIACGLTNWMQNKAIEKNNKDSLDPRDPHRFTITPSEKTKMLSNGIDPDKALLAIIAIRQQMGKDNVPSLLNRMFTSSGQENQKLLKLVRGIRSGALPEVTVGDMVFNLQRPQPVYQHGIPMGYPVYQLPFHGHGSNPQVQPPSQYPYTEQGIQQQFTPTYPPHYPEQPVGQTDLSSSPGQPGSQSMYPILQPVYNATVQPPAPPHEYPVMGMPAYHPANNLFQQPPSAPPIFEGQQPTLGYSPEQ